MDTDSIQAPRVMSSELPKPCRQFLEISRTTLDHPLRLIQDNADQSGLTEEFHSGPRDSKNPTDKPQLGGTWGAPIRTGQASPLRVATGGEASFVLESPRRRSPACPNKRRGDHPQASPSEGLRENAAILTRNP